VIQVVRFWLLVVSSLAVGTAVLLTTNNYFTSN
jgi:hypothetical protein